MQLENLSMIYPVFWINFMQADNRLRQITLFLLRFKFGGVCAPEPFLKSAHTSFINKIYICQDSVYAFRERIYGFQIETTKDRFDMRIGVSSANLAAIIHWILFIFHNIKSS